MAVIIDEVECVDQVVLVLQVIQLVFAKKNNDKPKGVFFVAFSVKFFRLSGFIRFDVYFMDLKG